MLNTLKIGNWANNGDGGGEKEIEKEQEYDWVKISIEWDRKNDRMDMEKWERSRNTLKSKRKEWVKECIFAWTKNDRQ